MIVFLHIPKTGGTTFRSILEKNLGVSNCHTNQTKRPVFTDRDFSLVRRFFWNLKSLSGHNLIDPPRLKIPGAFYMTILRDPITRVASHYQDSVLRGGNRESFEEMLRRSQKLQNLQVRLIGGELNLDKAKSFLSHQCHFVGFTEKFDLSLQIFDRLSPFRFDLNYRRTVVAKNDDAKKAILSDKRLIDMAREFNRLDLELYSFATTEVFPALCQKVGLDPTSDVSKFESRSVAGSTQQRIGRFYNKIFREFYKIYSRVWPEPMVTDEFSWLLPTHNARE